MCPCDASVAISTPLFIGKDYLCESGINEPWDNSPQYIFYPNDPLWDGGGCLTSSKCCSQHNPRYFVMRLSMLAPTPPPGGGEAKMEIF